MKKNVIYNKIIQSFKTLHLPGNSALPRWNYTNSINPEETIILSYSREQFVGENEGKAEKSKRYLISYKDNSYSYKYKYNIFHGIFV